MTVTIGRRELLAALGGAAAAWPLAAQAQKPGKVYRIGFLANDPASRCSPRGKLSSMDCAKEDSSKVGIPSSSAGLPKQGQTGMRNSSLN